MNVSHKKCAAAFVWARYVLPLITGITYTVSALFYSVTVAQAGKRLQLSAARLIFNTFAAARAYLGGTTETQKSWFYGLLAAGAATAVLFFLLGAFFAGLMLWCAWHAFAANGDAARTKQAKTVFRIAFPNRVCLFFASVLWLVPAFYPLYYAAICKRFLLLGAEEPIFVVFDLPLLLVGVFSALTLALAVGISRMERRTRHNLFSNDD